MTFQEFLELSGDYKYVTLNNFYRDHLYLRTLASTFMAIKLSKSVPVSLLKTETSYDRLRPIPTYSGLVTIQFSSNQNKLSSSSILKKQFLSINV